jgi:hypothetical protein
MILSSLIFLINWRMLNILKFHIKSLKGEARKRVINYAIVWITCFDWLFEIWKYHVFNIIDTLENKLKESENLFKKFSSDNLKSMLCIHSDTSNKPGLIVDDLSASTSHISDFELDHVDIKPVIVDAACSENSSLNNCVKPNSKDSGTQGKFVPLCHHCGKVGHIRPKCYLLKSHRPWKKQEDSKQGVIEKNLFR